VTVVVGIPPLIPIDGSSCLRGGLRRIAFAILLASKPFRKYGAPRLVAPSDKRCRLLWWPEQRNRAGIGQRHDGLLTWWAM